MDFSGCEVYDLATFFWDSHELIQSMGGHPLLGHCVTGVGRYIFMCFVRSCTSIHSRNALSLRAEVTMLIPWRCDTITEYSTLCHAKPEQ